MVVQTRRSAAAAAEGETEGEKRTAGGGARAPAAPDSDEQQPNPRKRRRVAATSDRDEQPCNHQPQRPRPGEMVVTVEVDAGKKVAMRAFQRMRDEGKLLDVTLLAGKRKIRAHKIVLAGGLEHFEIMFSSGMAEAALQEVQMEGISERVLSAFVDLTYSGSISFTNASACEVLDAATMLGATAVEDKVNEYFLANLEPSTSLAALEFAEGRLQHSGASARELWKGCRQHFLGEVEEFGTDVPDTIVEDIMISDRNAQHARGERLLSSLMRWAAASPPREAKIGHMLELSPRLRGLFLGGLSPADSELRRLLFPEANLPGPVSATGYGKYLLLCATPGNLRLRRHVIRLKSWKHKGILSEVSFVRMVANITPPPSASSGSESARLLVPHLSQLKRTVSASSLKTAAPSADSSTNGNAVGHGVDDSPQTAASRQPLPQSGTAASLLLLVGPVFVNDLRTIICERVPTFDTLCW